MRGEWLALIGVFVAVSGQIVAEDVLPEASERFEFTLNAGKHDRHDCVIEIPLPSKVSEVKGWGLLDAQGRVIPLQRMPGESQRLLGVIPGAVPAGVDRNLILAPRSSSNTGTALPFPTDATVTNDHVAVSVSGKDVLTYHMSERMPPSGIEAIYSRSGHLHPLRTPAGRIVTGEFPADHPHQHGVFAAWVNTTFEGHSVDFWNQAAATGTVRHVRLVESFSGPVFAGYVSELEHLDLTTDPDTVVLQETWRVMTLSVGDMHLIDIKSTQKAATAAPLLINEYHYGGFAWRGPVEWLSANDNSTGCQIRTSEGYDRVAGNHTRPLWVSVTGMIDGAPATVAILGHSTNFRHPQPVRLHPDKPYFCFAPCVVGEFSITSETPLVSRYRIALHDGPARPDRYDQLVRDWSEPASLEMTASQTSQ